MNSKQNDEDKLRNSYNSQAAKIYKLPLKETKQLNGHCQKPSSEASCTSIMSQIRFNQLRQLLYYNVPCVFAPTHSLENSFVYKIFDDTAGHSLGNLQNFLHIFS